MYSGTEVIALLCAPLLGALIGFLMIKAMRYKKDQEIREFVAKLMAEDRERRKHLVPCQHCLYGRTWRPEIVANGFPVDTDEPWMEDCKACGGEGFIPKVSLN